MSPQKTSSLVTLAVGSLILAVLFAYAQRAAFHSDEFNVLLHAGRFADGQIGRPGRPGLLWLLLSPLTALDNPTLILRGSRLSSWLAVCCTAFALVRLARIHPTQEGNQQPSWLDSAAPLVPPLALILLFGSGSFTPHSIEVRTDSFTTPLTLGVLIALWSSERRSLRPVLLGAALVGAAALISQKSFYNGVGLALAWLLARPSPDPHRTFWIGRIRDAALAIATVIGLIALWYLCLSLASGEGTAVIGTNLRGAQNTAFGSGVPMADKLGWLNEAVHRAPLLYGCAAVGSLVAMVRRRRDGRILASSLVGATLLLTLFVHRGFFPYYIASIEPFLALPAAWGLATFTVGLHQAVQTAGLPQILSRGFATLGLFLILGWGLLGLGGKNDNPKTLQFGAGPYLEAAWEVTNAPQMELLEALERFVPEPSPYVAGIGVVPGYREIAGYLTGDNRRNQRKADPLFIKNRMEKEGARFFVRTYMSRKKYLKSAERRLLYSSYLPVHPNLYLHGARVVWDSSPAIGRKNITLFVDGEYSLKLRRGAKGMDGPVRINGKPISPDTSLFLPAGKHEVEVAPSESPGELWLLLGKDLPDPPRQHMDISLFPKDRKKSRTRYQRYDTKKHGYDLLSPPSSDRYKKRIKRHQRALRKSDKKLRKYAQVTRDPTTATIDSPSPADSPKANVKPTNKP